MDPTIVRNFREILRKFEKELDIQNSAGCCCGITLSQCHALMELSNNDNISLSDLSSKLSVDKSSASRTVDNLVNKELVIRNIPKENRRVTNLALTKSGKQISDQINADNDAYYARALAAIPPEELSGFLSGFKKLAAHMKKINEQLQGEGMS